uniref:Ribonuclease H-like domain-containing protein n=1 Tax=Tanacetum cinerariifolium TaxID=118510 RepID=A0A6L2NX55_TANCI|nr:ribonuclease H-like domain-containing protein [Tanacetum cinerariifolium]
MCLEHPLSITPFSCNPFVDCPVHVNSVLFNDTECVVLSPDFKLTDENHVLLRVPRKNSMYSVDLKNIILKGGLTCLFAKTTSDESRLWHRRLRHLNFKTMNKLVKRNLVRGLPSKNFKNKQTCVACQKGKQHRAFCKTKTENSISLPLHMLHMDLFCPTFVKSLMKKMYCLVVTDDYSRFTWVFFLSTKDETSGILKSFMTRIENLADHKIKVIRCDNGTEFKNRDMNQFYEMKGIMRQYSVARTPQQNKVEAVSTACYVQNRVLVTKPHNKTSYELLHGKTSALSFMRPFRCPVTILNTIDPLGKFDGKGDEGFFVGYSLNRKAFRVFNSRTRIVEETLHIRCKDQEEKDSVNKTNRVNVVSSTINVASNEVNVVGRKSSIELPDDPNMPELEDISIFEYSNKDVFGAEADLNNLESTFQVSPILITRIHKDHPFEQVIGDLHLAPQTRRMSKNLEEHDLVSIVNKKTIKTIKIVYLLSFYHKWNPKRIIAIRLFLAYASFKDFVVYRIDVKSAFLYVKIKEEVYVCQPLGFEDHDFPKKVYKVENALYGLHQAPRAWYEILSTYLLDNGFQRGKIDKTLFIKRHKGVNTPQSNEDSLKHIEFLKIYTTLQKKVLDLKDELKRTKTAQQTKIDGLERGEDTSIQGRIDEIDVDEYIALVSTHDEGIEDVVQDEGIEDVGEDEVVEVVTTAKLLIDTVVDAAQVTTAITDVSVSAVETIVTTVPTITAEFTKTNVEVTQGSKRKGVMIQDPKETTITKTVSSQQPQESTKKDKADTAQESSSKREGDELEQERSKKQKVEDDKESEELKKCLEIVPDNGDDVTIDATPLSSKEDLEVLWRLVKARFEKVQPMDHMDNFLMHTLKTMFEHHVRDNVWKSQQGLTKVKNWKLYDSYGVHCVTMQNILYYMLVEKMLGKSTITQRTLRSHRSLVMPIFIQSVASFVGLQQLFPFKPSLVTVKITHLLFRHDKREKNYTTTGFLGHTHDYHHVCRHHSKNTPMAYRASTLTNPNPVISPAFVEANYEGIESLLRDRHRQMCNNDLQTKLEYFSEDYDEEREIEPRPEPTRAATPSLRVASPRISHLGRGKNGQPLQSSLTFSYGGQALPNNIGGNLPSNGSILYYKDLKAKFQSPFTQQKKFTKTHLAVHNIKQREGKSTRTFITRYTDDRLQILGLHEEKQISSFVHGLRTRSLVGQLSTVLPSTYKGLIEKTYTWVKARESVKKSEGNSRYEEGYKKLRATSKDVRKHLRTQIQEAVNSRQLSHLVKGIKKERTKSSETPRGESKKDKGIAPAEAPILMVSQEAHIAKSLAQENTDYGRKEIIFPPVAKVNNAPIIIEAKIFRRKVRQVYMDSESSCEIIYEHCFKKLNPTIKATKVDLKTPLVVFSGEHSWSIGRTVMQRMGIVVLMIHRAIKFHTKKGIRTVLSADETDEGTKRDIKILATNEERVLSCVNSEEKFIVNNKHKQALSRRLLSTTRDRLENRIPHRVPFEVLPKRLQWLPSNPNGIRRQRQNSLLHRKKSLATRRCRLVSKMQGQHNKAKNTKRHTKSHGKLAALGQFLSKDVERSLAFFKVLKGCKDKKNIQWTIEADKALKKMKKLIQALTTLTAPRVGKTLTMHVAASKESISDVLAAKRNEGWTSIYFVIRVLQVTELNYPTLEKLLLALVHAARRLQRYFQAHTITVLTNTTIKQMLTGLKKTKRVAKWAIELGEHDIMFLRRNEKETAADFLVEIPFEDNEKKKTKGDPKGKEYTYALRFEFETINNEAKYEALLAGLWIAQEMEIAKVAIILDSQLLVNQIKGTFTAKQTSIKDYLQKVKTTLRGFEEYTVEHVCRNQNKKADGLSKLASMTFEHLTKEVLVKVLTKRSIEEKEVLKVDIHERKSWIDPIYEYRPSRLFPEDTKEARKIIIQAPQYKLIRGNLYKRPFFTSWLRCVAPTQTDKIIKEIHEGSCGFNTEPRSLVVRIMKQGYFWPSMHREVTNAIQDCKNNSQ